jgi:hypothetical protein
VLGTGFFTLTACSTLAGVKNIDYLTEFIINVDESKLLKMVDEKLVLADEWWNCFSFTAY